LKEERTIGQQIERKCKQEMLSSSIIFLLFSIACRQLIKEKRKRKMDDERKIILFYNFLSFS
jgi:thymidylate kinase